MQHSVEASILYSLCDTPGPREHYLSATLSMEMVSDTFSDHQSSKPKLMVGGTSLPQPHPTKQFKNSRPQPTCLDLLSHAANSLSFRISCRQPICFDLRSPAASNVNFRYSCRPPTCLDLPSPAASNLNFKISHHRPTCLALLKVT